MGGAYQFYNRTMQQRRINAPQAGSLAADHALALAGIIGEDKGAAMPMNQAITQARAAEKNSAGARKARKTRQALIDAGVALFNKAGYEATSVKEIVAEAGLTKGAFYHHFESKEHFLQLIYQDYLNYQLEIFREVITHSATPRERVAELISCMIFAVDRYREHVTIFFQEQRSFPKAYRESMVNARDMLKAEFQKAIRQGIASGEFRSDLDPDVAAMALLGMCSWTYQWLSRSGRLPAERISEIFAGLALHGLCKDG
ncbi:MAG: TetR/AcrR family transcriptional regulator [Alphaproteobacteria bacterium]|nr:MAG: TetR/AcrR family transcriptional regulator [Alphaproteobacteria bacterium]